MGNAGSSGAPRERQKSGDTAPSSPSKEGQAFVFDKKTENKLTFQGLQEDEEPYFTKPAASYEHASRPRANTGIYHLLTAMRILIYIFSVRGYCYSPKHQGLEDTHSISLGRRRKGSIY